MAKVTPNEFAEKWARRLSGATEDIRRGVEKVSEAPSKKAVQKKEKMIARWTEAVQSGKWENALQKVSLEEWRAKLINKGLARIAQGVTDAQGKVEDFAAQLLPYIDNVKKKIETMPDRTLEDRINRAVAFMREMAKFKKA